MLDAAIAHEVDGSVHSEADHPPGRVVDLDQSGRVPVGSTITLSVAKAPVVSTPAPTVTKQQQAPKATKPAKPGKGKGKGKG